MLDDGIADAVNLIVRAEAEIVILTVGRAINPLTLFAVKRRLFAIARNDVLPDLRADLD